MKKLLIPTLLAAAAISANGAAIHTGLINYWTLDSTGAETANTLSGNTSTTVDTGAIAGTGAAFTTAGLFGDGVDLERKTGTDGRVEALDQGTDLVRAGLSLSISIWAQHDINDSDTGNWQGIIAHGEGNDYRIAKDGGGGNTNGAAYAGGTGDIRDIGGVNIYDGAWHHLAATTLAGGMTNLYVDGSLVATGAGPANLTDNGSGALWIGNNPQGGANRSWDGVVDDVGMWETVLTAADVSTIYNAGIAGTALGQIPEPTTGLLGFLGLSLIFRRRR